MIKENKSNYIVAENNDTISLYSYKSLVCEIRNNCGMGFNAHIVFGKDYKYSKTTKKHIITFLNKYLPLNDLDKWMFSDLEYCIKTGFLKCTLLKWDNEIRFANYDESIRFSYDETMK